MARVSKQLSVGVDHDSTDGYRVSGYIGETTDNNEEVINETEQSVNYNTASHSQSFTVSAESKEDAYEAVKKIVDAFFEN